MCKPRSAHDLPFRPPGRRRFRLRPIALATLLVFGWQSCEPLNFARAQAPPGAGRDAGVEAALLRLDHALHAAAEAAAAFAGPGTPQDRDLAASLDSVTALHDALGDADRSFLADFAATGRLLERAGAPPEIRERHRREVQRYKEERLRLDRDLRAASRTARETRPVLRAGLLKGSSGEARRLRAAWRQVHASLRARATVPPHQSLDPERLPHRRADLRRRAPRLTAKDFGLAPEPDKTGGGRSAPVLGLAAKAALPAPADLAPTIDAPQTQAIRDLAASLGNHPLRIFEYVRNEIDFTPTYGSIQGAEGCRLTRLCNAFDSASLLLALLRAAGVPARYALGTIEVPIAAVENWAGGFTDAGAALTFIASSGTPVVGVEQGGALVSARLEHVWVEAYLDYVPSRAAVLGPGDTWVPLDPSFKRYTVTPAVDFAPALGGELDTLFRHLAATAAIDPDGGVGAIDVAAIAAAAGKTQEDLAAYLASAPAAVALGDLIGERHPAPVLFAVAPNSSPYRILARGGSVPALPDALRHRLRFAVSATETPFAPVLSYEASLPELAAKRLTLSYGPASPADAAGLAAYWPAEGEPEVLPAGVPAYLFQVKAELRIEGELAASGAPAVLGQRGRFRMTFFQPGGVPSTIDNDIVAGSYNAVVLSFGRVEDLAARQAGARARLAQIQAEDLSGLVQDDVTGELLYATGLHYWSELDLASRIRQRQMGVAAAKLPSEGIFTSSLEVLTSFGVPRLVRAGAFLTDVDADVHAVAALDGDPGKGVAYLTSSGAAASFAEAPVWDRIVSDPPTGQGISAIAYLAAAAQAGIPIFHLDRDTAAQALPRLDVSAAVRSDIQNAVAAGKVVTIPQRAFEKDGFVSIGYVVMDRATGAAGYLIQGGLAGGGHRPQPAIPAWASALANLLLIAVGAVLPPSRFVIASLLALAGKSLSAIDLALSYQNLSPAGQDRWAPMMIASLIINVGLATIGLALGTSPFFVFVSIGWILISGMLSSVMSGSPPKRMAALPGSLQVGRR